MPETQLETQIPRAELLWREYQLSIDLYKFYFDIVIKSVIGYYAVTGGILSFYFTRSQPSVARWALLLPCLVSFALAWLFHWGAGLWEIVRNDAYRIADELGMGGFELSALQIFLRGAAALLVITGAAMVIVIVLHV
jgi:hypothetical protein